MPTSISWPIKPYDPFRAGRLPRSTLKATDLDETSGRTALNWFNNECSDCDFPHVLSPTQEPRLKILGIMSGGEGYHAIIRGFEGKRYFVETESVLPSEWLLERSGEDGEQKGVRLPQELMLSFRD